MRQFFFLALLALALADSVTSFAIAVVSSSSAQASKLKGGCNGEWFENACGFQPKQYAI